MKAGHMVYTVNPDWVKVINENIAGVDLTLDGSGYQSVDEANELIEKLGGDKRIEQGCNIASGLYYITLLAIRQMFSERDELLAAERHNKELDS